MSSEPLMSNHSKRTAFGWRRALRIAPFVFGLSVLISPLGVAQALTPAPEEKPAGAVAPPSQTTAAGHRNEARPPADTDDGRHEVRPPADADGERAGDNNRRRPLSAHTRALRAACPPTSVICLENSLPGNPPSEWDIPGSGFGDIDGYTTQISVNKGQTVQFKVLTEATDYRVDIYRIGYYSGMGARLITTVSPSVPLPQIQPDCSQDVTTGLLDCGNWAVSASWAVPASAVSGVYIANLIREDGTPGAGQMIFVVRDDERGSELLMQTSDATWQAYNRFGGSSLYTGIPVGRAFKVSYNRPFTTRATNPESFFFNSEYPMIRWLEANAYDVSYTSNVDTTARATELLEHKIFISVGHDEYWSNEMRNNVENARDNGLDLAFFSGNEIFWKTRWEDSADGTATPFRTLVCYKETIANAKIDPSPQWTGTWRDPRFSPPSNGGRPENSLTGTLFKVNGIVNDPMRVPAEYAPMRFWRNTSVATLQPGETAVFPDGVLGYEWDESPDNGVEPMGPVRLSRTTFTKPSKILLNFGSAYGAGTATHSLTLYRNPGGALVFGAGTTQWSWGLDAVHDRPGTPTDIRMQQATVNLFADMGAQPASLQPNLVPATPSTDTAPPTSAITSPSSGATVAGGVAIPIQGTASDTGGGVVAGVEISVDGGTTWFQTTGRSNWQYTWTPGAAGTTTIRTRAFDDIGNIQGTPTVRTVTVTDGCPCSVWAPTGTPAVSSHPDPKAVELGVKFQASSTGFVSGIRFYKGAQNTGTHTGNLWSSTGTLLARATFTNETATGWQQVNFSKPVQVIPGTTYVASYHTTSGNYSITRPYFTTQYSTGLLTALANSTPGGNGVYRYSATSTFPTTPYQATNYWVDVVFSPPISLWDDSTLPAVPTMDDPKAVTLGVKFQATRTGAIEGIRFYKGPQNTGTHVGSLWTASGQLITSATFTDETATGWQQVLFDTPITITANTTYVASYHTTSGFYSITRPYFTQQYTRGPLVALASAAAGGNGLYRYGATNAFPNASYQSTNYWVDVLFLADAPLAANLHRRGGRVPEGTGSHRSRR
ncbi:DUF4082 domain-containing protein [Streptosporangium roseum]|nr:DUF4082 domain-containing protein [Streptosporangium roseum]